MSEVQAAASVCRKCRGFMVNVTGGHGAICIAGCGSKMQPPIPAEIHRRNMARLKAQEFPLAHAVPGIEASEPGNYHTRLVYTIPNRIGQLFRRVGMAAEVDPMLEAFLARADKDAAVRIRLVRWEEGEIALGILDPALPDELTSTPDGDAPPDDQEFDPV